MTIPFNIEGEDSGGDIKRAGVVAITTRPTEKPASGIVAYTDTLRRVVPFTRPFSNESLGIAMNQNVSFSGNPTVIHAGVNSGSALTGTTDGTTTDHLIDSGETFSGIQAGMSVKNTTSGTEYALITNVAANDLTLDNDIFVSGETYEINPIWVGTAISGAWNFADAGRVSITAANNNDEASFDNDTNQNWDVTNFTALTLSVDLDVYNPVTNNIELSFDLNGVQVGDTMSLNDFIDTGDFSPQSIAIDLDNFNFASSLINGMTLFIVRSGGSKPTVTFDDIQFEASGLPLEFKVEAIGAEVIRVDEIIFSFIDAYTGIAAVAGATENHNGQYLSYNQFLGNAALTSGITFRRIENHETVVTLTFNQLSDFLRAGGEVRNYISDTTNTQFTLNVPFKDPIILYGSTNDFMSLTINDNLSGLIELTAFSRGNIEV